MFNSVRRSFALLGRGEKVALVGFTLARTLINLLDLFGLLALGILGTVLIGNLSGNSSAEIGPFEIVIQDRNDLAVGIAAIASFFVIKSVCAAVLQRATSRYLAVVEADKAKTIAAFLFSGDLERIKSLSAGDLQFAAGQATHSAFAVLPYSAIAIIAETSLAAVVVVGLAIIDTATTVLASIYLLILIFCFQILVNKRMTRSGERLRENQVRVANILLDLRRAFKELSVLQRTNGLLIRFGHHKAAHAQDQGLQRYMSQLPRFFIEAGLMVGIVGLALLQFLTEGVADGAVTIGVFLVGGLRIMASLLPIQAALADLRYAVPQARTAHELLDQIRVLRSAHATLQQPKVVPTASHENREPVGIEAREISFSYQSSDFETLKEVSFSVPPGKMVAIVGPSGAGKTTLVDLTLGLLTADSGKMLVGNADPEVFRARSPGAIGYVPQQPGVVSGSLAENVAIGLTGSEIDDERVKEALELAQLTDLVASSSMGIHRSIGKSGDALSGGQIQRLGLARALYPRPGLLVLDEATSALDASTEADIVANLEEVGTRATRLVIAHRLSTIQRADRVYVLDAGQIVAEGSFAEVIKKSPLVQKYVRLMEINREA